MKYILTSIAIVFALSFTDPKQSTTQSAAEVNQVSGCYLFVDSRPASEYDYLGTVKPSLLSQITEPGTGQYQHIRDLLIQAVKKKFPKANGIIFDFHDGGTDKADAILIK